MPLVCNGLILDAQNHYRALAHFEEFEFREVSSQLQLIPGCSVDASKGDGPLPEVAWSPGELTTMARKQFLRAVTICHMTPWTDSVRVQPK